MRNELLAVGVNHLGRRRFGTARAAAHRLQRHCADLHIFDAIHFNIHLPVRSDAVGMGASQSITSLPTATSAYTRKQKRAVTGRENRFFERHRPVALARLLIGVAVTGYCLLVRARFSRIPLALLSSITTFTFLSIDVAVLAGSLTWPYGARGVIWTKWAPFVWVEYCQADGPPTLPTLQGPTLRWWGRW